MTYTDPYGLQGDEPLNGETASYGESIMVFASIWGEYGVDPWAWQHNNWWMFTYMFGAAPTDSSGTEMGTRPTTAPHPCSALSAVSFVHAHQDDAATVAQRLAVPTQNVLGLSGIESTWGQSNAARFANNFFGLHGGADAPFANGVWHTRGGVAMSAFPSYLASAQSFAAQWGAFVRGISDATQFAQALVDAGFNSGVAPLGNPNFVHDTAATINATAGRMGCP
jgi:hypothetical protein